MAIIITFSMVINVSTIFLISIEVTKAWGMLIVFGIRSLKGFVKLFIVIIMIIVVVIVMVIVVMKIVIMIIWFLGNHLIIPLMNLIDLFSYLSNLLFTDILIILFEGRVSSIISITIVIIFIIISPIQIGFIISLVNMTIRIAISILWLGI